MIDSVDLSIFLVQLLTGLAYGMLLFMIAAGLSIIFGLLNVINLAHGALFLIGGYVTLSLVNNYLNFWLSLLVAILVMALLSVIIERLLLEKMYGQEFEQVLLTFGLMFFLADVAKWIWGTSPQSIPVPDYLASSLSVGIVSFPVYRLFVVLVGCLVAVAMWYLETKTRIGAVIRAGVDDREMLGALGINYKLAFTGVFAFGAALAGLAGGLGGPILGLYTGMEGDILILSLVVVVIGGLGTWKGSFVGAILVGLADTFGQMWFPSFSMAIIFIIMGLVLLFKPSGLFGKGVGA